MKKSILHIIYFTLLLSSCSFFNKKPQSRNKKPQNTVKNKHKQKDTIGFSAIEASNTIKSFVQLQGKNAQLVASWNELIQMAQLVKQIDKQDLVTVDIFAEENYQASRKLLKSKIPKKLDKPTIKSRIVLLEVLSNKLARKTLRFDDKKEALEDTQLIANTFNQLIANIKYELENHPDFAKDLNTINTYTEQ